LTVPSKKPTIREKRPAEADIDREGSPSMSRTTLAGLAKRCPWGLAGMVALILMVEGAIEGRALHLFDVDDWAFRWTDQAVSSERTKGAEILCFGDSLVKLSVIPSVVRERTGKRVYNLALSGSQATTSYFLLRKALESGARPEAVVVDFNPPLLRVGPRHILTRWGALIGPIEAAELAWWARDADLFAKVALDHALPSLRGKPSIGRNIKDALAGQSPWNTPFNTMGVRNWDRNDGAQLMVGCSARNLSDAEIQNLREGYYPEWSCHPANAEGIDHFLALATRNNIRVFWLIGPLIPALHDKIAQSGIYAQHDEFLRRWQVKYPDLVVLDARKKVGEIDAFWDPQHLSVIGASAFSKTLGDVLRRSMSGKIDQNWVSLPDVKIGPLPPGIENIDESRLAVEAKKVRR
jgi:hypothetical protein